MSQNDTRSLSQIRRDAEQTRAALTATAEELRNTVSDTASDVKNRLRPDALKAEVSGYIRSRGEQLLHDVQEAARRNPMQAIAVGASIAYPAFRLARAIPPPALMLGVGLFLAGSKKGRELTQRASEMAADAADEASRRVDEHRNRASDLGDRTRQAMSDIGDRVGDTYDRAGRALSGSTRQASDQADAIIAGKATQMASRTSVAVQSAASQLTDAARDAQARAIESGRELFDTARQRLSQTGENLSEVGQSTVDAVRHTIKEHPMLVAGLGLLVGGLIASVLPKSEIENNLIGGASGAVKRKARQVAAAGLDSAKNATGEILDSAQKRASEEGLTPEALAEQAEDVRERVRRVAERASTVAFDTEQQGVDNSQGQFKTTGGER